MDNKDDYYYKYLLYKNKYLKLKNLNQKGGTKKCSILDTDKILLGDGGSTAIIIISKDKKVYKVFTQYIFKKSLNIKNEIKSLNKRTLNEIKIYEILTKNIINKNISKHIVKFNGYNSCNNGKELFKKCPKSYTEFLKIENKQKDKICKKYFKNTSLKLDNKYKVVEIEYCDYSCNDFIKDISELPIIEMERYLDIFFFQIIYTIVSIQKVFPYFTHNDLFIRNILGLREKDNGNYYTYKFNNKKYFVPQKKFFPKINDFGLTNLNNKYKNVQLYKSDCKDIYNILLDVYNGGNLGSESLTTLCKDDQHKLDFLKKYFSNFFNVDVIDTYIENSKENIDWDWDAILDKNFLKSIEIKKPKDLLDNYFYNIFKKINSSV